MEGKLKKKMKLILEASRKAAVKTERLASFDHVATKESLAELVGKKLSGRKLVIVSNREPYTHYRKGEGISWYRTAGGLTTAMDSMAAACDALWVCYGDGDADFDVTDDTGHVRVPPANPRYTLKRLPLSQEEVEGYYEGFANETLWPLCHIAYIRPRFLLNDWECYRLVNKKFADAIAEETPERGIVFLQDYHLCLVAKFLKERRPDLTTVLFWHIPWPNPEIFRICPWKKEILEGLLANDILGFHLDFHANNFAQTVDQELESLIDWDRRRITRNKNLTLVSAYPISIDFTATFTQALDPETEQAERVLIEELKLTGLKIGLGVDRIDYTKGIPERLDAIERLFEKYTVYRGKFVFLQIGVPSRTHIEDYRRVIERIERRCDEINARFSQGDWKPLIFLKGRKSFDELLPLYRLADLCVVSSLHDGMNLVAKEFVAASGNDRGVLLLSRFTGAGQELEQALLLNPYDTESFTEALKEALDMPAEEQRLRLERMRTTIAENNIFTWAQAILNDVVRLAEDGPLSARKEVP